MCIGMNITMAYKKVNVFLLIAGTTMGMVLSANMPWITAMEACARYGLAPFDPDRDYISKEKWIGTAKYNMSCGVVTLQIEETEDEKHCSAHALRVLSEAIVWNGSDSSHPYSELLRDTIKDKCILADFNSITIKDLPTPTHCMMNQGNSSQYVSCEDRIDDGCQNIDNLSQLRITFSFIETAEPGTTVGMFLSANMPWISAMETCVLHGLAPFDTDENHTFQEKWIGRATYNISCGVVTLQIEETEDEKRCSAFDFRLLSDTITWNGTSCSPTHSGLMRDTIGDKCTLADFNSITIKDLPTPTHCMMHQGNSSQYVSCEKKINDGCQKIGIENLSRLRITLRFTETGTGKKAESCTGNVINKVVFVFFNRSINISFYQSRGEKDEQSYYADLMQLFKKKFKNYQN
uniref:Uncharacterized protein LOC111132856 isoform X3 n=1 Tax=Crassostrea virginica TaxID=6565 RepID=A0A8B8EAE3_CRAVI|nr:uncharacterized protein LOC111132856 isoform X3 [Crassostrea virginica]